MSVRAKFKLTSYSTQMQTIYHTNEAGGTDYTKPSSVELRTLVFYPVMSGSKENQQFFRWSPSGKLELGSINPNVWEQFELDKEYYLDFTEASNG